MKNELEQLKEVSYTMGRTGALMEVGQIVLKYLEDESIEDKSVLNELATEIMKLR
jgi:hypothetical protein